MEGQIIAGKYRLVRPLGKGGMGSVWLAEHLSLKSPVAVKIIDSEVAKNPDARSRFDREAQVAARIPSAHVVKILDHGVGEDGLPYIVMECLVGESLRERLGARRRLALPETARVVSHVCRALSRAHAAGLVHRDLKPDNIFYARTDDDEIVKILDFGVAKITDILTMSSMDPTRTGALLGTPYYMSPEQAQGLKTVDHRSDLWSLGVVVFECLTGGRPFSASALGPLVGKITTGPIPTLSYMLPGEAVPPELEAWMGRALARDAAARFASAKELADSFRIAAGVPDSLDAQPASAVPGSSVPPEEAADLAATVARSSSDATAPSPPPSTRAPDPPLASVRGPSTPPPSMSSTSVPATIPSVAQAPPPKPVAIYVLGGLVALLSLVIVALLATR